MGDGGFVDEPADAFAAGGFVDDHVFDPRSESGRDPKDCQCEGAEDARVVAGDEQRRGLGLHDLFENLARWRRVGA